MGSSLRMVTTSEWYMPNSFFPFTYHPITSIIPKLRQYCGNYVNIVGANITVITRNYVNIVEITSNTAEITSILQKLHAGTGITNNNLIFN
jgi:hypothetical protein